MWDHRLKQRHSAPILTMQCWQGLPVWTAQHPGVFHQSNLRQAGRGRHAHLWLLCHPSTREGICRSKFNSNQLRITDDKLCSTAQIWPQGAEKQLKAKLMGGWWGGIGANTGAFRSFVNWQSYDFCGSQAGLTAFLTCSLAEQEALQWDWRYSEIHHCWTHPECWWQLCFWWHHSRLNRRLLTIKQ